MSTNATINLMVSDGSINSIYNHFDGDIEHLGTILYQYYQNMTKVCELIGLGDVSSVGIFTEASPFIKRFNTASGTAADIENRLGDDITNKETVDGQIMDAIEDTDDYFTEAFHRDDGVEKHISHFPDKDNIVALEYNYLFVPDNQGSGTWYVDSSETGGTFQELRHILYGDNKGTR